ncbi:hypothetical protein [Myxococcus sp. AB056]|uniref:hypothetical protein n=1 Tax=Myxococcus sp. AB056 TaxID=2562792 RepID=UPI001146A555|nr:hypothetical protein [Myxococcus sp. AB056]
MKNFYLAMPLALALTGCVDSPPDIQIFNAFIPDVTCAVNQSGVASAGGSLDISTSRRYLAAFSIRSTLQPTDITVSEAPVTGGGDAVGIYVTHVELAYDTQGTGPSLTSEVYPSHFSLPSDATANSTLVIDLLGASALETLTNQVAVGSGVTVNVGVKLIGKTVSGAKAESNEIAYPISFYNSGFTCPTGTFLLNNGPCGGTGGQDNFPPACSEPPEDET